MFGHEKMVAQLLQRIKRFQQVELSSPERPREALNNNSYGATLFESHTFHKVKGRRGFQPVTQEKRIRYRGACLLPWCDLTD
jgi:hypothetical protein